MFQRISRHKKLRRALIALAALVIVLIALSAYLLATSPFAQDSIIPSPFVTSFSNGHVELTTRYTPHFYSDRVATVLGFIRGGNAMVWDRLTSPKIKASSYSAIVSQIHALRFDPAKPFLISGDQFDALYPRNLSVFYQDLLNPHTSLNVTDWHDRERIAVQSDAYALSSMQQLRRPFTTFMPISPHGALALNVYSYPSDTMFGVMALQTKLNDTPETSAVAHQLQSRYGEGLAAAYQNYIKTVRDPGTGLVRQNLRLSSARDAAIRSSSFYDNVILWKTEQLATGLSVDHISDSDLATLRTSIIQRYWDQSQGHFIDDVAPGDRHSYSSDWLIALPTGFLNPSNPADLAMLQRSSHYIDTHRLTDPLPIRYTDSPDTKQSIFVKLFVGSYGTTAIWSYWGDLYITLETDLYQQTGQPIYADHAENSLRHWQAVIVRDHGYPETLDNNGDLLETFVYESIRRNGWIVDFESAQYQWLQVSARGNQVSGAASGSTH